jgi:hypothetical protein
MPAFDTPEPITATIDLPLGDAGIRADDRRDTTVEVRPSDPSSREDVEAAEATRVELSGGKLLVRAPRPRAWWSRSAGGSVDVTVALPAGSYVRGTSRSADFRCDGRFGDCRIKTGIGHIRIEEADTLFLKSGAGDISVDRVTGHADVTTGSGDVRLRELDRGAVVKNANGDVWVGAAGGDVRVKAANGSVAIDVATAGVDARSANGDVRLGEAVRGAVTLATHAGDVEVGVRPGSAAWLDVTATGGKVYNELDAVDAPADADERLEVRARTSLGNVVVRRP